MLTALDIAAWFISLAQERGDDLSNIPLQKLLYYAQGHHLAIKGRPLFQDRIEAWNMGPVVGTVYDACNKNQGSANAVINYATPRDVDEDTGALLLDVYNAYSRYSAGYLINKTHTELPWKSVWNREERHILISTESMTEYFRVNRHPAIGWTKPPWRLQILIERSSSIEGSWVSRCLNLNIVTQGVSAEDAVQALQQMAMVAIRHRVSRGVDALSTPAEPPHWARFQELHPRSLLVKGSRDLAAPQAVVGYFGIASDGLTAETPKLFHVARTDVDCDGPHIEN